MAPGSKDIQTACRHFEELVLGAQWYYRRVDDPAQMLDLQRLQSCSRWRPRYRSDGLPVFSDWGVVAPNTDGHVQVWVFEDGTPERLLQ